MVLTQITHIVPVGHTKETLVDSIRQFPVHKVVLLLGKDRNLTGEKKVYETADKIEQLLKGIIIERKTVEKLNVFEGVIDILHIVNEERARGHKVMINISGSLRTIGIACYIAALITDSEIYSAIPAYDNKGQITGIKEISTVPLFPIKEITAEQIKILNVFKTGVASIEDLIKSLNPGLKKGTDMYTNERARLNHHIKLLRKSGFLESEKIGKMIKFKLSRIGEAYIIGKKFRKVLNDKGLR